MDDTSHVDPDLDPCPRRTSQDVPCDKPRNHVGHCGQSDAQRELYRQYIRQVRERAKVMSRREIAEAVEYHLITWRVLRNEYNAR